MAQAPRERILTAGSGDLVDEALDREHVHEGAQRAQGGRAQRHVEQPVVADMQGRERIGRHGVTLRAATVFERRVDRDRRHRRVLAMARAEEHRRLRASRPRAVPVAPDVAAPVEDFATRIERRLEVDAHRRSERRPRELILARPGDLHGLSFRAAREHRRVEGRIVLRVVAVASGALDVLDDDALGRDAEREREIGALVEDALRVRPDVQALALPARDGARRRDRGVREIRPRVRRANHAGVGRFGRAAFDDLRRLVRTR